MPGVGIPCFPGGREGCICAPCSASAPCAAHLQDACLSPKVQGTELPEAAKGDLLDWVRNPYRGITSYSELKDPQRIHLHLGESAAGHREREGGAGRGGTTGWLWEDEITTALLLLHCAGNTRGDAVGTLSMVVT